MRLFSIELSSRCGSIALVEDGEVVAEKGWEENFKNRQQLFDAMREMEVDWATIELFAVGRGPGAFSGMRIAFSVINALAAPGGTSVYALNSGAALAAVGGATRTVVVGDARRSKVWAGLFSGTTLEQEFRLLTYEELPGFIPADALIISPDQDRLEELLSGYHGRQVVEPLFPAAGLLGKLVHTRVEEGLESEPFEPLYMHPPVFVEPRFPA
jgi:tRNA threonylcarbamoyladenosine biosynthesis protein TsaB